MTTRVCSVTQSSPTLCNPTDWGPPGSSVHGILQARTLEWVACPPAGDLPDPAIKPTPLMSPALAGGFFSSNTTWEAPTNAEVPNRHRVNYREYSESQCFLLEMCKYCHRHCFLLPFRVQLFDKCFFKKKERLVKSSLYLLFFWIFAKYLNTVKPKFSQYLHFQLTI